MKEAYSSVAPSTSTPHYNVWSDALNKVQAAGYSTQNMDTWRGRSKSPLVTFPAGQDATLTISLNDLTLGPVTCNGDLNGTFHTNIDDLLLMVEGWGHGTDGDVTGDGFSDIDDLLVVLGDYGCDHR